MAVVGLAGALLTALGFAIGGDAWGWVVLAVFVVTVLSGLVVNVDVHALVAGILLNVWFLVTLSAVAGLPTVASTHPWNQALAWLIGAAIAIALITALWLIRDESRRRRSPLPEIPDDLPPIKLSRPIVLFVLIRAIAVSGAVAIAFGLQLTNADWMPLATLVAMKPTLQQSTLRGTQRLVGTALGAAIAAVFLVTVTSIRALEEIIIVLMGVGLSVYAVNYALIYRRHHRSGPHCLGPASSQQPDCRGTAHLLHVRRYRDRHRRDGPGQPAPEAQGSSRSTPGSYNVYRKGPGELTPTTSSRLDMQSPDEAPGASQAEQAAPAYGTAGSGRPGTGVAGRPGVQRARRACEWGKQKHAGSWADLIAIGVVIILGAVVGLVWQERGLSFAAAFRKLRRAS
jgi:Fusaric acid resistance protein-like